MAMSSTSTPMNNTTLENLVKCAICLDYYNDPRCLPCSHTFCYQCIEKLCEDGMGQCPMRDNSIFFLHTIDKLPVNRIAKDLVECLKKSSSSSDTKCDHCKQISSEFLCETCSKNYCTTCLKLEHNINHFQTHQIHIILEKNNSNHFCEEHLDEKLKYWCTPCEQLVCSDCLLFKHKEHAFLTLQDMAQKTKIEFNSSLSSFLQMKTNLQKFNEKLTKTSRTHYQLHQKTKIHIEQMFNNLQNILEKRKQDLIHIITERDSRQQKILQQHRNDLEEYIKVLLIRELFTKQLLSIDDHLKLIQIKADFLIYNQLIQQQYQQLIQGSMIDHQHFYPDHHLSTLEEQLQNFGEISTQTFLMNQDESHPLIKLSLSEGDEMYQEFRGLDAYGYRFHLTKPLKINTIRVKVTLFNADLTVYILNHNDILIQKETIERNDQNCPILKWLTIPLNCQIEHNYYIFIWTQPTEDSLPIIAYKQSNYNLRQINEQLSVRSKRAEINLSKNVDINTKLNVIYDALFNNDDDEKKTTTIPAIEMILDI